MNADHYRKQVALLMRVLPLLGPERSIAVKGGTAINLFVRDMPRLSVDIDLTYLPIEGRAASLANISAVLSRLTDAMKNKLGLTVTAAKRKGTNDPSKLVVSSIDASIKIEPNEVLRGSVYPPVQLSLCQRAAQEFEAFAEVQTLALGDLFGGKLCAALDRQHPRDLFDMKLLLENEGLTSEVVTAFVVYLASHSRTMHELLRPTKKPLEEIFKSDFVGMATIDVTLAELEATRDEMVKSLHAALNDRHREFLLSMKRGEPNFAAIDVPHIEPLPAIQWKLQNLRKLMTDDPKRHSQHLAALKKALAV